MVCTLFEEREPAALLGACENLNYFTRSQRASAPTTVSLAIRIPDWIERCNGEVEFCSLNIVVPGARRSGRSEAWGAEFFVELARF